MRFASVSFITSLYFLLAHIKWTLVFSVVRWTIIMWTNSTASCGGLPERMMMCLLFLRFCRMVAVCWISTRFVKSEADLALFNWPLFYVCMLIWCQSKNWVWNSVKKVAVSKGDYWLGWHSLPNIASSDPYDTPWVFCAALGWIALKLLKRWCFTVQSKFMWIALNSLHNLICLHYTVKIKT